MSKASLRNGTGPGSSISLAPETVRVRDALIEKFSGAPLEDMTNFMAMALSNETDELRRLGILAARIYLLRHRVANLREFNRNPSLTSLPGLDTTTLSLNLTTVSEPSITDDDNSPIEKEQWSRIQMTEPGEVNGVRFLAGTIIDAQTQDADKLIHSGKAIRVNTDGKIIEHQHDDSTISDANADNSDETGEVVENATSTPQKTDDDTKADTPQVESEAHAAMEADQPRGISEDGAENESDQSQEAGSDKTPKAQTS